MAIVSMSVPVSMAIEPAVVVPWISFRFGVGLSRGLSVGRPLSNEVMSDDSIGSCAGGQLDSSGRLLGGQSGGAVHSRNLVDGSGQVTVAASLGLVAADSDGSGSESRDHSDTRDV